MTGSDFFRSPLIRSVVKGFGLATTTEEAKDSLPLGRTALFQSKAALERVSSEYAKRSTEPLQTFSQFKRHAEASRSTPTEIRTLPENDIVLGDTPALKDYCLYLLANAPGLARLVFFYFKAAVGLKHFRSHTLIIAGTGAGKSELIKVLFWHLRKRTKATTFILEPQGNLARQISRMNLWRSSPTDLVYISPTFGVNDGLYPHINPFWIPLQERNNLQYKQNRKNILSHVIREVCTDKGHLSDVMLHFVEQCLEVLLEQGDGSFYDLYRFMDMGTNQDLLRFAQKHYDPTVRSFFANRFGTKQSEATRNSITTRLESLAKAIPLSYILRPGKPSISLDSLIKSGKTVVVDLSKGALTGPQSKTLGMLITALVYQLVLHDRQRPREDGERVVPVYMVIDEFADFQFQSVETALSQGRQHHFHLVIALQYLAQLDEKMKQSVIQNTSVTLVGKGKRNHQDFYDILNLEKDDIRHLKTRKFFAKVDSNMPFLLHVPSFLFFEDYRYRQPNYMNPREYVQGFTPMQLRKYYRPLKGHIGAPKATETNSTTPTTQNNEESHTDPLKRDFDGVGNDGIEDAGPKYDF